MELRQAETLPRQRSVGRGGRSRRGGADHGPHLPLPCPHGRLRVGWGAPVRKLGEVDHFGRILLLLH